jgi:hypothetical protein
VSGVYVCMYVCMGGKKLAPASSMHNLFLIVSMRRKETYYYHWRSNVVCTVLRVGNLRGDVAFLEPLFYYLVNFK